MIKAGGAEAILTNFKVGSWKVVVKTERSELTVEVSVTAAEVDVVANDNAGGVNAGSLTL